MSANSFRETIQQAIGNGTGYIVATDQQTLATAGNLRITMKNNHASKKALVYCLVTVNSNGLTYGDMRLNPTTGLPSTAKTVGCAILGDTSSPSSVEVKVDTSLATPLGGGTHLFDVPVPQGREVHDSGVFILNPGVMVGINVPFAGAGNGEMIAYFVES